MDSYSAHPEVFIEMERNNSMNPVVRLARQEDISHIMRLFEEVLTWTEKKRYMQTIDIEAPEEISAQIEAGSVYICDDGASDIAATFTLLDFPKQAGRIPLGSRNPIMQ